MLQVVEGLVKLKPSLFVGFMVMVAGLTSQAWADTPTSTPAIAQQGDINYVARIQLHTEEEIADLFSRAEQLLDSTSDFSQGSPIAFVLHGPEVEFFASMNYGQYKSIVDKAAQLDAFQLIDVRVCSTYLRINNISPDSLPPFVDVVPFGPEEEQRLRSRGYVDF